MNKLLIDDYPLQVLPKLAEEIGLNEAIFVQQLHYWINGKSGKLRDGRRWVYNTYEDWQDNFPFWSVSTIRRTITSCEEQDFVITGNYNKLGIDKTKWYTINYDEINRVNSRLVQNEQSSDSEWADGTVQNEQTITRDYPETTSETNKNHSPAKAEQIPYKEIIEHLNEKTGKNISYKSKGNRKLIRARWNEDYTLEDFKKVIDNKVADWFGKDVTFTNGKKAETYLHPSTLFRQSNFDKYLNENPNKEKTNTVTNVWGEL